MKKILLVFMTAFILVGCTIGTNMSNTPTKRVENYLNNYQTLDTSVLSKLDLVVNKENLYTDTQKTTYRDILKKHYQDLVYTVKEETINGDKATVEVEIETTDYTKLLKSVEAYKVTNKDEFSDTAGTFNDSKFIDYKLDKLKDAKDKVKYTMYFTLTKTNNEWVLDTLTNNEEEKILGIYEY